MNTEQSLAIVRMVAAYQPSQKLDGEYTHKAWIDAMRPHDFRDATDAVMKLGKAPRRDGQPFFFEIRDVLAEIHSAVAKRLESRQATMPGPPSNLSAIEYQRWLADSARAASARDWTPPPAEIEHPQRPIASLVKALAGIRSGAHHPEPKESQ